MLSIILAVQMLIKTSFGLFLIGTIHAKLSALVNQ